MASATGLAKFLFVHNNFPGQFAHLIRHLLALGHEVHGVGWHTGDAAPLRALGLQLHAYPLPRQLPPAPPWPHLQDFQTKLIRAEGALRVFEALRQRGLEPDMVVAHPGWGEGLFLKDVWPRAVHLHYLEFFYSLHGRDMDFDPEFRPASEQALAQAQRLRLKNLNPLVHLEAMDAGWSPTRWQRSTYPDWIQDRIEAVFDGIDTASLAPQADAVFALGAGRVLRTGDPVVTFVNRNLEPYRGYHVFMRALPKILRDHPQAQVVVVGGDGVSYGASPPAGQSWREIFLSEVRAELDLQRVHFVGHLPRAQFTQLLQVSACHVYLTYPFVLSWSCVEAMSVACPIVASDTAPVREFLQHGHNALLVDFFDTEALGQAVLGLLRDRALAQRLGHAARAHAVAHCDWQTVCLPQQLAMLDRLLQTRLSTRS